MGYASRIRKVRVNLVDGSSHFMSAEELTAEARLTKRYQELDLVTPSILIPSEGSNRKHANTQTYEILGRRS